MKQSRLEKAAARLVSAADPSEVLIVGGLAVALHGYLRATRDVDLVCRGSLYRMRKRLAEQGVAARLRRGDPSEGDFSFLRGEIDGIPFDILPPIVPLDWAKASTLRLGASTVGVVDLAGLLALKLRAQGPQDLLDVAALVLLHPGAEPTARRLAKANRVEDRLQAFLENPRLRAQVMSASRGAARVRSSGRRPAPSPRPRTSARRRSPRR
jgi:hypothetical protein